MPAYRDPHERFWEKVAKRGPGDCWLWTGGTSTGNGGKYGSFSLPRSRKMAKAHRWAWEERNGPLPTGLTLDHLCRVTLCVNPDHLEPVTNRENILRGTNPAAVQSRQTHCVNGHPLSGENLRIAKNGQRMCRECRRRWNRERKARLREGSPDLRNGLKTHCKRGHLFDDANTYLAPDGSRHCRACSRERALAYYYKRKDHL